MTAEKFIDRLGKELRRRRFLGKAAASAAGAAGALFGAAATAGADTASQGCGPGPLCCCLCDTNVPIGGPCQGAFCTWSWTCCWGGQTYACIEGYYQDGCPPPGNGACTTEWRCSTYRRTGAAC